MHDLTKRVSALEVLLKQKDLVDDDTFPNYEKLVTEDWACACLQTRKRSLVCDKYPNKPLFIALPLIAKSPDPPAPCPITAGREILAHQRFDLIRAEPVRRTDLIEADMIAQRHLNDFTYRRSIEIFVNAHTNATMSSEVRSSFPPRRLQRRPSITAPDRLSLRFSLE